MKTLRHLLLSANVAHQWHGDHCVILPGYTPETHRAIFALSDYKVESCEGGCFWLRPVERPVTLSHTFWDSCSTEPA